MGYWFNHSNLNSFNSIKNYILENFEMNDKLILGNIIGLGKSSKETLTSVIEFRFNLMSKLKLKPESIILRGQEEMFSNFFNCNLHQILVRL